MAGFLVVPPQAFSPGGLLNPARVPFWGLNDAGDSCNEGPLYFSDPWDTFFINDDQLPAECEVQNVSLAAIEVEKFKGKNQSGASIKFFGYLPGGFDVVCKINTAEQWEVFQQIQGKYWAGPLKTARPPQLTVRVRHPDINRLRVYQAVLVGVPLAEKGEQEGYKNFRFKFHEQVPTKATAAKKAGGAVPEDPRLIASNATPALPSANPENASLAGPPNNTNGGAP